MKQIFLFSGIVLGLALLLLVVYNLAFVHNVNNPKVENATVADASKSITAESIQNTPFKKSPIESFSDERSMNPVLSQDGQFVFYIAPDTRTLKKINLDTQETKTLMTLSLSPLRATWSPNQEQVLVEMRNSSSSQWFLVDIKTQTETALKIGLEDPVWTNIGDKIVYKYYDVKTKERSLSLANPDGSNWQKIGNSPFKNMSAQMMPQSSLFVYWNQGNAFEPTSLHNLPVVGGDDKILFSGKFGADFVFSPDGQKVLMSSTNKKGGTQTLLGLLLHQGTQYQSLGVPSFVSKAVWSPKSSTVYYALPGNLPESAVLPNDYFSKSITTQDTFWRVDVATGEKTRVVETKDIMRGYDATFLMVRNDESQLLFVNRLDGKLYSIALTK
jgi:Tol biopolymer transport system component